MIRRWGHSVGLGGVGAFLPAGSGFQHHSHQTSLDGFWLLGRAPAGSRANRRLQRVPVIAGSLVQLTSEGGSELLLYRWLFQLVGVKSFRDFLSLGSSHGLNMQLCLGDDETMVFPTVRAAHCLGHSHVLPVFSPDNDIVD